jgi:hypothetical protein
MRPPENVIDYVADCVCDALSGPADDVNKRSRKARVVRDRVDHDQRDQEDHGVV